MNFDLPPQAEALRAKVRKFAETELMPLEAIAEEARGDLPREHWHRIQAHARDLNLLGMSLPKEFGGQGYSTIEQVVIEEELGKVTNILWDMVYSPAICLTAATPDQIERYVRPTCQGKRRDAYAITEEGAGSDASQMSTRAERHGDTWRINGDKWHVTSADVADYMVVQADTDQGITLFFVDMNAPGVELYEIPEYMHTCVVKHPKIRLKDVEVPHANILGEIGGGLALTQEWFRRERLMIAARCCGAAQRLIDEASAFAQSRIQFGQPISEYQAIQAMLADALTELWASRLMTYAAAQTEDAIPDGTSVKLAHARASMVKLHASEMANRVADRAVQIFGGRGYMREFAAERFFRELRVDRIWEGTSEIQRMIIARSLFKRGAAYHYD
jgi:alkylation response protein AidB-like acyl-CoA dehydrogenase